MKACLFPLTLLAALLAFAVWTGSTLTDDTARWREQLARADALARSEDWAAAEDALAESYADWSASQTYLHIVAEHDTVDDAEAMYRRALAFAAGQEPDELRAEIAGLRDQLRLLAELERLDIRNIL